MMRVYVAAALLAAGLPALALETPTPGTLDSRLRSVAYSPDQVFRLSASVGYASYIQLAPGEEVDSQWIGDAGGWSIETFKNLAVLKPTAIDPVTNLIFTTNLGRVYNLDLRMADASRVYYGLRFSYPLDEHEKARMKAEKAALQVAMDPTKQLRRNLAYTGAGSQAIQPTAVFDNGRYTFLHFSENRNWPAVFRVIPDGDDVQETLVNPTVRGNWLILPRVSRAWRLRQGSEVLCIRNEAFAPDGATNFTETASPTTWRVDKP